MTAVAKKVFSYFLKATILVLAFTFIYHQYLTKGDNLKQFETAVNRLSHQHVIIIMSVVVLLMLCNWLVEALKWQHLSRHLVPISLWKAVEGVFCGLTWAVFTPNRIGEYGGRVMFLPPRKRIHGVFAMAVGALGQLVITNVLGAIGLVWFIYTFKHFTPWLLVVITIAGVIFIAFFLTLYFNVKWLVWLFNRISFLKKYHRFFDIMGTYKLHELAKTMCFCLTRFFIFSFQYYLVIHLLIPAIPFHTVVLMVFIVLFVQSALPSLDLLDVPVRATAAATVFHYVTGQQIAIIAAFSSIWLINLIIPAILGTVFIFKLKFFDRNV